jgi:monofunctional biosynthetic peptidoglycan transglycosylase
MRQRETEAAAAHDSYRETRHPVPLDRIARQLREAVLVAEDDKFFTHDGFDWAGIRDAARRDLKSGHWTRGGSTITQQLAKNLWLGTERTPWRKLEEMFLAIKLERALTKRRILELYLNTIEWGDGVYGVDAAARRWFGVGAGSLDAVQAIRLAAVIVNPRKYSPTDPNRRIRHRVEIIATRLRRRGAISQAEYRAVLGLPPEAPAPAVDSTLFTPQDLAPEVAPATTPPDSIAPTPPPAESLPPEPPAPQPDSGAVPPPLR